jgi:hypothetical protein
MLNRIGRCIRARLVAREGAMAKALVLRLASVVEQKFRLKRSYFRSIMPAQASARLISVSPASLLSSFRCFLILSQPTFRFGCGGQ